MTHRTVATTTVPNVTIYVRHSIDCTRKADEFCKNCRCPKHLRWYQNGKLYRQSAKTRTWSIAEQLKQKVMGQFGGDDPVALTEETRVNMLRAVELFLSSKRSQGIGAEVVKKYERELSRFVEFMAKRARHFPAEIRLDDLTEFRADWNTLYASSTTRAKVQERLRSFLRYCYESQMIERVPRLSPIKVDEPPTMPLTEEQYADLLAATGVRVSPVRAQRVRALIQTMRYSGLAIMDAVMLERGELRHDVRKGFYRIVTSRQKTGTHVSVPIPPHIAHEILAAMPLNANSRYIFWNTGTGKVQTAVTNWQHEMRRCFRAAGQMDGHPHQLRDTFAVWLLERGTPLEEVSKLLGHTSIKTTEKHYAKWVQARQDRLDDLVQLAWKAA